MASLTSHSGSTQVLVLGGGLAGAAAAISLARAGTDVTLLEREAASRHKVCGEFLSAEALSLLHDLGVSLPPDAEGALHTVRLASGRRLAESALPFAARSLTRRRLDRLLLDVAEQAGVRVLRGVGAEALLASATGWQATLTDGQRLCAPRAILATGKHDLRGFPRPRGVQGDLVAMKMYFRLVPEQHAALGRSVELLLHPHGYTGLEPVEDGAVNLTALVRRHHLAKLGGWPGLLGELLRSNAHAALRLQDAVPLLEKPLAISMIPYGFVRREALAPGLYAVGDQAAVIPSFTGDGMSIALCTGLHAARSILEGRSAAEFQRSMHAMLRWQVFRATTLSRILVHPSAQILVGMLTGAFPYLLRQSAATTRLPQSALRPLLSPTAV